MRPAILLASVVLAEVSVNPEDAIASGTVGAAAIGAIWWLIRDQKTTVKELTAQFQVTLAAKDALLLTFGDKIVALGEKFDATIKSVVDKFDNALKEMRQENRVRDDRNMDLSSKMVGAVEHVTAGLFKLEQKVSEIAVGQKSLEASVTEVKVEVSQLKVKVEAADPRKPS